MWRINRVIFSLPKLHLFLFFIFYTYNGFNADVATRNKLKWLKKVWKVIKVNFKIPAYTLGYVQRNPVINR